MTIDTQTRIENLDAQIRPLLQYEADLVEIYEHEGHLVVVLRTRDDDELHLRLV